MFKQNYHGVTKREGIIVYIGKDNNHVIMTAMYITQPYEEITT